MRPGRDLTSFILGLRLGREFLIGHGPKIKISHERLDQVERFFAEHDGKAIFLGRFIGLILLLSPFIAGASKMPARRFIAYTTLAAGIWAGTFSVLGYLFCQSLDQLIAITKQGSLALAALIVLVAGGIAIIATSVPDHHVVPQRVQALGRLPIRGAGMSASAQ